MDWCCITICLLFCQLQNSVQFRFMCLNLCVCGCEDSEASVVLFLFFFCNVKEGPYNELLFDSSLCEF